MFYSRETPETISGSVTDARELWFCLLLSLFLQIFLIVCGTFRRLSARSWIVILLWLAYLLAEIVAIFGLGLIVSRQRLLAKYCNDDYKADDKERHDNCYEDHLHIFFAPFLLLHLGGPDTITAFAPEDNELWLRHVIYLASQCTTVAYCFYQSLQFNNPIIVPTLLMLSCGIIKCTERTAALYYGSAKSFRNSMLSKSDMDANVKNKKTKPLIKLDGDANLSHLQVLQYAFVYFTAFKGLVVDLSLSIHERNQSREFFLATSSEVAFRLVEVELNYLYDVLFTKLPVLHHKLAYWCRISSFIAVVVSFRLLINSLNYDLDTKYIETDFVITYILFIGAIVLEIIAFYMLLFCDWTIVKLRPFSDANPGEKSWKDRFVNCILYVNHSRSTFLNWFLRFVGLKHLHQESKFTDSRWAQSFSAFNLIFYCLHRRSEGREIFYSYFGLVSFLNRVCYVKLLPITNNITGFIFDELKMKSELADSLAIAKEICSSKGEWVLREMEEGHGNFLPFVVNYNFDDILLLWHIATELCFNDSEDKVTNKEQRDTAKQLSDYMLYLMVMKPDMMSAVSGLGEIKFRDTCTEVSKFFDNKLPEQKKKKFCHVFRRESKEEKEGLQRKACEIVLNMSKVVEPDTEQRDRDIFFNASLLAKELKVLPSETKWLMISKLWVELLSYAASHIRSSAHAEQISKGGELITVVWLLMAHFGLGEQYEINPGKQA